jgi:hypothetical protein
VSNRVMAMRRPPSEAPETASLPAADYLGPARVSRVGASSVDVELPAGKSASARLALAFPYRPAEGDTLLVIARGDHHYVIGVLEGHGQTSLAFEGEVEIHARRGALKLSGDHGVEVRGPEVSVETRSLRMTAEAVVQKFTSVYQRVSALLSVRARESETIVEETALTRAKKTTILSEESVSINGRQVNLG